jgi:signal transduction histidine kinase
MQKLNIFLAKPLFVSAVFLVLSTVVILVLFLPNFDAYQKSQQYNVHKAATEKADKIRYALYTRINFNKALAFFVEQNPKVTQKEFEDFVTGVLKYDNGTITSMAYEKDLKVTLISPYDVNNKALGLDLTQKPGRKENILKAIEENKSYVEGPSELTQGGIGIISFIPVYHKDTITQDSQLLGVVDVIIQWEKFLEVTELDKKDDFINIAIRGINGTGKKGKIFYGDSTIFHQENTITIPIALPMGEWILAAHSKQSWIEEAIPEPFIFSSITALAISIFIFFILKYAYGQVQKSEAELIKANRTKDRFFSIIAHDLKNPISSLYQMSELLFEDYQQKDKANVEDDINLMNDTAKRTYALLENLLEWSRSSMGVITYAPEKNDIIKIIDSSVSYLKIQANVKNITLQAPPYSNESFAFCDANMILTVIRNLVSNAIKFSFNDSIVTVAVTDFAGNNNKNNYLQVSVSDSGTGIDPTNLNKLFKIDEKICSKGTNDESGTGLGLILCKEFIDKHNCKIWVESTVGKGTTFFFTLLKA